MIPGLTKNQDETLPRTFLAIPIKAATLNLIESVQQQLRTNLPQIRWTRRDNLHLTLRFFGDISEENLEKAAKIMVSVGSLFAPFSLALTEIGAFPSTDRAHVVWIGVQSSVLGELYNALQKQFNAAGFPIEHRPFRPHITIGRSRQRTGRILSLPPHKVAASMRVDELILFESRLQLAGAEHLPRHSIRLAEPRRQK
jgi:2'-5' RNA ligase